MTTLKPARKEWRIGYRRPRKGFQFYIVKAHDPELAKALVKDHVPDAMHITAKEATWRESDKFKHLHF